MAIAVKTLQTKLLNTLQILNTNEKKVLLEVAETLVKEHEQDWSAEQKTELDELKRLRKAGKSKSYSVAEVKKHALKAIKNDI